MRIILKVLFYLILLHVLRVSARSKIRNISIPIPFLSQLFEEYWPLIAFIIIIIVILCCIISTCACLEKCYSHSVRSEKNELHENNKCYQEDIDLEMLHHEGNDDIIFQSKIKFINKINISREGLYFVNPIIVNGCEITENEKIILKGYFPYLLYLLRNEIINNFVIADIALTSMAISSKCTT